MKQKKCPQCKNLILVSAPTCLYCGRPNKFVTTNYVKKKWEKENNKKTMNISKILISRKALFFLIVIFIIFFISLNK